MKYTTKQLIERLDTEIEMVCCDSARADWQTLKNRVLTPQADNTGSPKCPNCNSDKVEWIGRGAYGCGTCSHVWGCFS